MPPWFTLVVQGIIYSGNNSHRTFFGTFFKMLLPFKNENYFTLDNLSKYGHITLKFVGRNFIWVVTIFSKNWGQKKNCQNPFSAIL